jgi:NDP-sugar pyrophosphorylase family protein
VQYVFEPELLGTAGAVKNLSQEWLEPFLVVYGDNLFNFSIPRFYAAHKKERCIATIALFDRERHLHTGIAGGQVVLSGERITHFIEGSQTLISPFVNAGSYILEPKILEWIAPKILVDFGKDLFPKLLEQSIPLARYLIDGYCLGIDTPESYQNALRMI